MYVKEQATRLNLQRERERDVLNFSVLPTKPHFYEYKSIKKISFAFYMHIHFVFNSNSFYSLIHVSR